MKINELIVAMNSLQWDIETFKKLKDSDINYYAEAIENIQELLLNLDRQLKTSRNDGRRLNKFNLPERRVYIAIAARPTVVGRTDDMSI